MKKIKVLFKLNDSIILKANDFVGISIKSDCYLKNIENFKKIGLKTINNQSDISKLLPVLKKTNLTFSFLFFGSYIFSETQLIVLQKKSLPKINILNWIYTEFENERDAKNFIIELNKYSESIQYAYIGKDVKSPNFDSTVDTSQFYPNGGHLEAIKHRDALDFFRLNTPNRIDSYFGKNIKIAIVERSAILRFPDIDNSSYYEFDIRASNENYRGSGSPYDMQHGLNTIGVIKSKNDNQGISGIAPEAELYISSFYKIDNSTNFDFHKSIITAILSLICSNVGVLLIELYTSDDEPMEVLPEVFELIETANHFGITTILPAGNSPNGKNLNFIYSFRNIPVSSAIMVGATNFFVTDTVIPDLWNIYPTSNYGRRIDTYICGENILTTSIIDLDDYNREYRYGIYRQTSGASAIIAGMVAAIQDVSISIHGTSLSSLQIKDLLRNNYQTSFFLNKFTAFQEWWNGGKGKKYKLPKLDEIIKSIIEP